METAPLERAIKHCGSQRALADRIGRTQQHISFLLLKQRKISVQDAIAIERATENAVKRWELRPDFFQPEAA